MGETLGPFNLILLVVPGVALKIAVRIMYGGRVLPASDPLHVVLSVASTLMLVLAALGGVIGVIGFPNSPAVAIVIWVPLVLTTIVIAFMTIDRFRHGEHRALVWTLAAAAQRGVPLSEAARAYADETQGATGARAMILALALEQGQVLSLAVRQAGLRLSTPQRLAVRLGEALGVLGPAMRQEREDSTESDSVLRTVIGRMFYLYVVVFVACFALTFVMLRIVPVYQRMFQEFGIELPRMTMSLISFSNVSVQQFPVALALIHLPLLIGTAVLAIYVATDLTEGTSPEGKKQLAWLPLRAFLYKRVLRGIVALVLFFLVLSCWPTFAVVLLLACGLYFIGWFPRDLPGLWRLFKRYDGAMVMRGLALAVRRGVPLDEGLQLLAAVYPIRQVGRRLEKAAARVVGGEPWPGSLLATGLIGRADAAVLASAERAGNLPWALEEMADSAIRRQAHRLQAVVHILFPLAVLAIGMGVAFFALGLFLPLVSLIQSLS